ncbi:hypothetical protein L1887_48303 [Cichorium endivia]|nr:hypothetical protein L1887_48303 [Cichorium endivia]
MFSVKRFDAFAASSSSSSAPEKGSADSAKLDALNERILKKRKLAVGADAPSPAAQSSSSALPKVSTSAASSSGAIGEQGKDGAKGEDQGEAKVSQGKEGPSQGEAAAAPKKQKNDPQQAQAIADNSAVPHLPEEEKLQRLEASRSKGAAAAARKAAASSASGSSSSSDSDSDSDADSDSEHDPDSGSESDESEPASPSEPAQVNDNDGDQTTATTMQDGTNADKEVKALERFPLAGVKAAVDRKLINSLGLPEGLSNRVVVNPSLSRPLPPQATGSKDLAKAQGTASASTSVASASDESTIRGDRQDDFGNVALSDTPSLRAGPLYRPFAPPRDLCVSAPTGSGKTLAYTVPIVEVLRTRQIVRLRALIVLPTRDLVSQVRSTLELVAKGSGLRIATATGHHSFAHEQTQLVEGLDADDDDDSVQKQSKVDILIATPGRLIDHLDSTPGFTLAHLRFLVIDEADRLLNQSFQEWLRRVLSATEGVANADSRCTEATPAQAPYELLSSASSGFGAAARSTLQEEAVPSVQKLLFSATLTRDPAKIAALGLRNPHYITVQDDNPAADGESGLAERAQHERFSLPHSLHEHMLVTTSADKPFHLLYLLHRPDDEQAAAKIRKALCFTKSVESAARLVKLVEMFEEVRQESGLIARGARPMVVKNYSSELRPSDRQRILAQFGNGEIDLTARAGKHGDAWTLVEEQEARHFKKMVRAIMRQTPITKVKLKALPKTDEVDFVEEDAATREMRKLRDAYEQALDRMAQFYRQQ